MNHPPPSDAALALLKEFERGPNGSYAPTPYRCPSGHLTIGWGHVIRPSDRFFHPLSEAEADDLLHLDVLAAVGYVGAAIGVNVPLTQSMIDALACFAFNVGQGAFLGSTLLFRLNARDYARAADEFLRWDKATDPITGQKKRVGGLIRRRQAERDLFLREGIPA